MRPMDYGREHHKEMLTELSHLPEPKRRELDDIVQLIAETVPALRIILFGSYARGDYKEEKDLAPDRWSGHASDYDLLVIVPDNTTESDTSLEQALSEACNARGFSAHVRPIVHRLSHVNAELSEGRYFFLDIKREGRSLYHRGGAELAEPRELSPEDRRRIAQAYFDDWFENAREFYGLFEFSFNKSDFRRAAFNLNQAAESAYKCILLVHTLYSPQEHLLQLLAPMASEYGPVFEEIFPQKTEEQQELFQLLDNAYIAARYRMGFKVYPEHLDYLAERVKALLAVTEDICRREIDAIGE